MRKSHPKFARKAGDRARTGCAHARGWRARGGHFVAARALKAARGEGKRTEWIPIRRALQLEEHAPQGEGGDATTADRDASAGGAAGAGSAVGTMLARLKAALSAVGDRLTKLEASVSANSAEGAGKTLRALPARRVPLLYKECRNAACCAVQALRARAGLRHHARAQHAPPRSERKKLLQCIELLELRQVGGGGLAAIDGPGGEVELPCAQRSAQVRRHNPGVGTHAAQSGGHGVARSEVLRVECVV